MSSSTVGISIAKHRLKILKLHIVSFSKLVRAINKTKKGIKKCVNKWGFHRELAVQVVPEKGREEGVVVEEEKDKAIVKARSDANSGPIDGRNQEKLMGTKRTIKLSGLLDVTTKSLQFLGTPDSRK